MMIVDHSQARVMLEQFLEQVKEVEAKYALITFCIAVIAKRKAPIDSGRHCTTAARRSAFSLRPCSRAAGHR
jgi:hypothetical protein